MNDVRDDEHVWRDVYFNRDANFLQKPVRPPNSAAKSIFGTRKAPTSEISGNLYDRVSLKKATELGDERGAAMTTPETVKGWWKMMAEDVRSIGCSVERTDASGNAYHADICLPEGHCDSWEDAIVYLRWFLSTGTWENRAAVVLVQS